MIQENERNLFFTSKESFLQTRSGQSKKIYFFSVFMKAQNELYVLSEKISGGSIFWETFKKILPISSITLSAAGLAMLLSNSLSKSHKELGSAFGLSGIALISATGIYSASVFSNELNVKEKADITLQFFGSFEDNQRLMEELITYLYREFFFPIEMLAKSEEGMDKLILFFVQKIFFAVNKLTQLSLERLKPTDKLNYLKSEIFSNTSEIPEEVLATEASHLFNLGWKLSELIRNAPIISVSCLNDIERPVFNFQMYKNISNSKWRFQPSKGIFLPQKVLADDSHKYPVKIVYISKDIDERKGYGRFEGMLPEQLCIGERNTLFRKHHLKNDEVITSYSLVKFFYYTRICAQEPTNLENFMTLLENFNKFSILILGDTTRVALEDLSFVQNLRDIYLTVLFPAFRHDCYFGDQEVFYLWERARLNYFELSNFRSEPMISSEVLDRERSVEILFPHQLNNPNQDSNVGIFESNIRFLKE